MKIITIEEHLTNSAISQAIAKYSDADAPFSKNAGAPDLPYFPDIRLFRDAGDLRIAEMDKHGIDMQVLSCASQTGLLEPDETQVVADFNDEMAAAVAWHPDRFAAFATLPWSNPQAAAKELERCVTELGFKGAILSGRPTKGNIFLDDEMFLPVLETAARLKVPVYVHPGAPSKDVRGVYYTGLGEKLSARLSLYGWGWHHEAGIQVLRTILAGVFDKLPDLQLIAGHWGEMVPFFLSRLDEALPQKVTGLRKPVSQYFKENVYVTPSGIFDYPQMNFCAEVLGTDRIIHSVDCPFIPNDKAREFIENAPLSDEDKEKIAHLNAERLFNL